DGVGTKLLLAIEEQKHETIRIDCVAMGVNVVVAQGVALLYFLNYLALRTVNPAKVEAIVAGVAAGCCEANAALIGGETGEMPDMYEADAYDVAGFAVG
ncbi:AIR synthase related protein, partial [Enterococcus faecium]